MPVLARGSSKIFESYLRGAGLAPAEPTSPMFPTRLLLLMLVAVAATGMLAYWTEENRASEELADFGYEQAAIAEAAAPRLAAGSLGELERRGSVRPLVYRAGDRPRLLDGTPLSLPAIDRALASGAPTARIERVDAPGLGFPERIAMVGFARIDATTTIGIIASAADQRDRDLLAQRRLIMSIVIAAGLVSVFGGIALHRQRKQLGLQRELAVADAARASDTELERLSRAATMVAVGSGVAHELSTPLGVIVGRAEQLLSRANGDERIARNAQAILDEANHIDLVVRGLLGLARGAPIAMQQILPAHLARDAAALVEHRFQRSGVKLVQSLDGELPAVRCEPLLFKHALVNLLLNACEASTRGTKVVLDVRSADGVVSFTVADEGHGITPENAARATKPFFTTKGEGTGLGLAIANEIVATHRGSLEIAARSPRGTSVALKLPLEGDAHV